MILNSQGLLARNPHRVAGRRRLRDARRVPPSVADRVRKPRAVVDPGNPWVGHVPEIGFNLAGFTCGSSGLSDDLCWFILVLCWCPLCLFHVGH